MWARGHPFLEDATALFSSYSQPRHSGVNAESFVRNCASGSLDDTTSRITTRLLELMALQAAHGDQKRIGRIAMTSMFSMSLTMHICLSLAIIDVAGLRALFATAVSVGAIRTAAAVLSGLASYVGSRLSRRKALRIVGWTFASAAFFSAARTRLARRRRRSKVREDPDSAPCIARDKSDFPVREPVDPAAPALRGRHSAAQN